MKSYKKVLLSSLIVFALSGCGGGGTSDDTGVLPFDGDTSGSSDTHVSSFDLDGEIKKARDSGREVGYFWSGNYPIIEFKDKKPIVVLTLNQAYSESGVEIVDSEGNDLTSQVQVSGSVDTTKVGKYIVEYTLTDENGEKFGLRRYVFVVKNTAPTITLKGSSSLETYLGKEFTDPGYTAFDREDREYISSKVTISGNLNLAKAGEYEIVYTVTDSAGETSTVIRDITVIKPNDIKSEVLVSSTKSSEFQYSLWDYMVNTIDTNKTVSKYHDSRYIEADLRTLSSSTGSKTINVSYTDKTINYTNLVNGIKIEVENNTSVESVVLKEKVKLHDVITKATTTGQEVCTLKEHYDEIKLANKTYEDVIKIECPEIAEAYYQKDRGIILENVLPKEESLDAFSLKELSYTPPELEIIDFKPEPDNHSKYNKDNYVGEKITNTTKLFEEPYLLSGNGLHVGVVDGGNVLDTHVEFAGRVKNLEDRDISPHSTHVAGTIGAAGINLLARGYANKVNIEAISFRTHSGSDSLSYFAQKNIFITNHSYGSSVYLGGDYNYWAQEADKVVTENPDIIALVAAGNARNDGYGAYRLIDSFNNAKNIITVGSIGEELELSAFSSTGPTSLGRIKPDIVAKGESVDSLAINSDNKSYATKQGTSMATPAITGIVTLLQEQYIKVNDNKMREDIAKGLLIQSATDLGRFGPDYEYGFGLPDSFKAVKIIDSMKTKDSLVEDKEIKKSDFHRYSLTIDDVSEYVRLTLSWIDPTISAGWSRKYTSELNTDLDMTIVDGFGNVVYAYTLNGESPQEVAKEDKNNRVDNVEQIETRLNKGEYTVFVRVHKMANCQTQKYSLFSNIALKNHEVRNSSNIPVDEFETKIVKAIKH